MTEQEEKIQHEIIKSALKLGVDNNPYLSPYEKQIQKARIDEAAANAELLLSMIKYLSL